MQQNALGRIDTQAREQFWVTQRQLDHLAQLLDGFTHAADIVIIDDRTRIARRLELGAQLNLCILVDMDDALGCRRDHAQANLREGIGRCVEHAAHFRWHVLNRLLSGRCNKVTRDKRLSEEVALQRLRRALQTHFPLRRRKHYPGRRARFGDDHVHMFARPDLCIAALETVEPHHIETLIFVISGHGDSSGCALSGNLDDIALGDPQRLKSRTRHARDTLAAFFLSRCCDLQSHCLFFYRCRSIRIGHWVVFPFLFVLPVHLGVAPVRYNEGRRRAGPLKPEKSPAGKPTGLKSLGRGCLKGTRRYACQAAFVQVRKGQF